ncbi:unnamed protein product [Nezara viridula]|uniref:Uncharacterized protein n=1 Tax=Nezara viridula TaxID=85310 RepID=A0A9P0HB70_NEZVI|nr:unnamed protein product [Nezara viridula]
MLISELLLRMFSWIFWTKLHEGPFVPI